MRAILLFVSLQFLMVSAVHGQLSERARRILGKEQKIAKDSLVVVCRPNSSIANGKLYIFKQLKGEENDLNGSTLVDFPDYNGKRKASFEVRSTHGNISLGDKPKNSAAKFMQRWSASSPIGTARFTVNALGHMTFYIKDPKSAAERVIFFTHSSPQYAIMRVGQARKATYICEHQVLEDSKLIVKETQGNAENSECVVQESDPSCILIDGESKE